MTAEKGNPHLGVKATSHLLSPLVLSMAFFWDTLARSSFRQLVLLGELGNAKNER